MIEWDAKLPPMKTALFQQTKAALQTKPIGKRKYVDESDKSSATDPEEDNLLVTSNIPPPPQRITHYKTRQSKQEEPGLRKFVTNLFQSELIREK